MQNFQYILMVSPFWHWKFESAWFWKRRCFSNVKYDGSVKSVIYSFLEESFVGLKTPFSARVRNSLNIWKIGHLVIREIQSNRQWWKYSVKFISISFFFSFWMWVLVNPQNLPELLPSLEVNRQAGPRAVSNQEWWILWIHQNPFPEMKIIKSDQIWWNSFTPKIFAIHIRKTRQFHQ